MRKLLNDYWALTGLTLTLAGVFLIAAAIVTAIR